MMKYFPKELLEIIFAYVTFNDIKNIRQAIRFPFLIPIANKIFIKREFIFDAFDFTNIKLGQRVIELPKKKLPNLVSLDFGENTIITGASLVQFTSLTSLNCGDNVFSDFILSQLSCLKTLKCGRCHYIDTYVTDTCLFSLRNLTSLGLGGNTNITDKGLLTLKDNLKCLNIKLYTKNITTNCIKQLTRLTRLKISTRYENDITDDLLFPLHNLVSLDIKNCETLTSLSVFTLSNLTYLSINRKINDDAIKQLVKLKQLKCNLNCILTNQALYPLQELELLYCGLCRCFTNDALFLLPNLTELDCEYNQNFTYDCLMKLPKLKKIKCSNSNKKAKEYKRMITSIRIARGLFYC